MFSKRIKPTGKGCFNVIKEIHDDHVELKYPTTDYLALSFNDATTEILHDDDKQKKLEFLSMMQEKRVNSIVSHWPYVCPISDCGKVLGINSVLSHCLVDHHNDGWTDGIECKELHNERRAVLDIDITKFEMNSRICLGCIVYGGLDPKDPTSRPAERGISTFNSFLPKSFLFYKSHMPIMIMCCLTTWANWFWRKEIRQKCLHTFEPNQQILIFWATGPETLKPIHVTLTIHDKQMLESRSSILTIRALKNSQNPAGFFKFESNFLMVTNPEILLLTDNGKEKMSLDIFIREI